LAAEISPDRLRRFFLKIDKGYQVAKRVRDLASLRAKTYVMIRLSAISIWSAAGTS
jgi:hypothetical protein